MWYKFRAYNSQTQYGWTQAAGVAEAACDWLNRGREINLYGMTELTDAEAVEQRLGNDTNCLVTQDSTADDFEATR